jgi:hypothetical protein
MRQNLQKLVSVRSIESYGQRHLLTRGQLPRNLETLATHQSMRGCVEHYSHPRVTKVRVALRGLRQEVGRPWNDVYSELRQQYRQQRGIASLGLERILSNVERNTFFAEDGGIWARGSYDTYEVCGLYVHPSTGVLMYADGYANSAKLRKEAKANRQAKETANRVQVSPALQMHKVDGLWYWVELSAITAPTKLVHPAITFKDGYVIKEWTSIILETVCRDVMTGQEFHTVPTNYWENREAQALYGKNDVFATRKWQASRADVQRYVDQERLAA